MKKEVIINKRSCRLFLLQQFKKKLLLILFLIPILGVAAKNNGKYTKLSVELTQVSILDFFDEIEQKTDFKFLFNTKDIDPEKKISIRAMNKALDEILYSVLKKESLQHLFVKKQIVIKPLLIDKDNDQSGISGIVTNGKGKPLSGVNILVKGSQTGTVTQSDGTYSIQATIGDILVFSLLGFTTHEEKITQEDNLHITLVSENIELDKVVLVGYGKMNEKDVSSAIKSIDAEKIKLPVTNSLDRLFGGKIAGLNAVQISGSPGAGAVVNIRGRTSFRGINQPLYIVDGVPLVIEDNLPEHFNNGHGAIFKTNPLELIDPSDILKVEVLKDAAAASIYGSRAANGVILITTKRGKKNHKPQVTLQYTYSANQPVGKHNLLNAQEYKDMMIATARTTLQTDTTNPLANEIIDPVSGNVNSDYFMNSDTDWQDLALRNHADVQNVNLNVSGGSESSNYFFSLGKTEQEGIFIYEDYSKYNMRLNYDTTILNTLKVGGGLSYQTSNHDNIDINSLDFAFYVRPDIPARTDDGSLFILNDKEYNNILSKIDKVKNKNQALNISSNVYAELRFFKHFALKSAIYTTIADSKVSRFYGLGQYDQRSDNNSRTQNHTWENILTYNKSFNKHRITPLLGTTLDYRQLDLQGAIYFGFPSPVFNNDAGLAEDVTNIFQHITESRLHSYFGRINYNYDKRYYLSITNRADGYSKFGVNKRWAYFPSLAVSWSIANESFLSNIDAINELRLRFSVGRTGRANLPDFANQRFYSTAIDNVYTNIGDIKGIALTNIPDKNIGWETTEEINYGINTSVFNSRISLQADYFKKSSTGMIMYKKLLPSSGFNNQLTNSKSVIENKGLEIELEAKIITAKELQWDSSFNISFIKNTIKKADGSLFTGLSYRLNEGESMGAISAFVSDGIFKTQEEIDNHAFQEGAQIGDLKYVDINEDGIIDFSDFKVVGDNLPQFFGGWNNAVRFNNFELGIDLQFSYGAKKQWAPLESVISQYKGDNITHAMYENTWSPGKPDTKYPQLRFNRRGNFNRSTDALVEDASYIRLRNISLRYHLPTKFLNKLGISQASIYTNTLNLITWTPYPGIDPEGVNSSNLAVSSFNTTRDYNGYPITRTFSWGINISL
ncbi:SusC/RagA family TonB-linked outer membrane protein [Aquimarina aquimarini]|uniref:SusC/RagA family TonB-linked outer membrane protein n=1 Tax=Aquimarina aquimarini TaxID=1191734 RepID=UPI000D561219|nr:TonB-dependent receptor [Aquimarina aquimarini]